MRTRNTLMPASGRQLDLMFRTQTLERLSEKDRKKAILTLACLLMQAGLASEKWRGFLELKGNRNAEAEEFYQGI